MTAKITISLILGLLFQLVQMLPAAVITGPCPMEQGACGCCTNGKSCHCAENSDPDQKPAPAPFEAGRMLKLPEMKATETKVFVEFVRKVEPPATLAVVPAAGPAGGFTGVALSVAFCRFVI